MKRYIIPILLVSVLTACPSPFRWIDTPADYSPGRVFDQGSGKEIVSFSFGIEGEKDLPIGTDADISGKIPILVILPEGTGLTNLSPLVKYIGKSLNPSSGLPGNFSSPVVYTVTAEDNTTQDYIVRVYETGDSTKEIIRLTIDVFRKGGSPLGADGIINQDTGDITVTVPPGTSLTGLTAHVTYTGAGITGPWGGRGGEPPDFTFSGDFSNPTIWTVFDRNGLTKLYTLYVVQEKDSTKEIDAFSLRISGETDIISGEPRSDGVYPILALVPDNSAAGYLENNRPSIKYRGAALSPGDDRSLNFNTPVRYTVSAEDGTTRDYEVQIIRMHQDNEKMITGFYFKNPLVEGVIDQVAHTIALAVPPGTNLNGLVPEIYYKGVSVSPPSGQPKSFVQAASPVTSSSPSVPYTVYAADGSWEIYNVYVFTDDSILPRVDVPAGGKVDMGVNTDGDSVIFVEFPTYIPSPVINISYPPGSLVVNSGDTYNYYDYSQTVKVIAIMPPAVPPTPPAPADPLYGTAEIDAFYFTNPAAIGSIGTTGTGTPTDPIPISVRVPFGTDLRNLTAGICYTGKEIAGHPGANPIQDTGSFTSAVDYTVNAYESGVSKTYRVTVGEAPNPAKEITAFSFSGITSANTVISAIPNAAGNYPIDVTVPPGTAVSSLTPVITHTGVSITSGGTNFTSPVNYTVTAGDTSTKTYTVTVHADDSDDEPELLAFYFGDPLAVGLVNQNTGAVTVTVPSGTNTKALTPALYFKGVSVRPNSGAVNDFSSPATYTVTGSRGKTKSYLVTVIPTSSSTKDITSFGFPAVPGAETIIGAAPDPDGTYPLVVWVPAGTALGGLTPVISHTGVSVDPPAGTPFDFNNPKNYTVIAEDGSSKTYKVTVTPQNADARILTSFVFNEVPFGTPASYVRAVGSINQADKTVTVMVPYNANTANLIPTLTYIGRSVAESGSAPQTANPFTGTGQNFIAPIRYSVYGQSGDITEYTVQVIMQSVDNITFEGEADIGFAASAFDQQSGIITITVNTSRIDGPYGWYVNGVKQAGAEEKFTLNVGNGFPPGRHEVMVSGNKDGLRYTAKVYFTVSQ